MAKMMKGRPSAGVRGEAKAEGESAKHELAEQTSRKGDSDDTPRRRLRGRKR